MHELPELQKMPTVAVKSLQRLSKPKKNKLIGTADYIAPEVIKGEAHTYRLDFWALGVIVYEMLTGALPFNDETPDRVIRNILRR